MSRAVRRHTACLLALMAAFTLGGGSALGLANDVNPATPAAVPALRIGIVQASPAPTATRVSVLVDEESSPIRVSYQAPYVPVAGDTVNVLLLGGSTNSGIVLGLRSGQAGNLVPNSDFGRHPQPQLTVSKPPYMWTQYTASGQVALVAGAFASTLLRHCMLMAITVSVTGVNYAYSAAIPVTPGETLYGDLVYMATVFAGSPTTVTVSLRVAFFASETDDFPSSISESTLATQATNTPGGEPNAISGNVVVPSGVAFARAAVRVSQAGGDLKYTIAVTNVELTRST